MNMFGHLKAEDFTNLLDGAEPTDRLQAHLHSCAQCLKTFESVQQVRNQIEEMRVESAGEHIPEPDWLEFRADVRNGLLSRSVKRENATRGWFARLGWQPAMAWGMSMLLVLGLLGVIWSQRKNEAQVPETAAVDHVSPVDADLNSLAEISQGDVFDDLVQLDADEALHLQMVLDDMVQEGVSQQ
jgi:hypothetical protein